MALTLKLTVTELIRCTLSATQNSLMASMSARKKIHSQGHFRQFLPSGIGFIGFYDLCRRMMISGIKPIRKAVWNWRGT
jgi:hypothetical protein